MADTQDFKQVVNDAILDADSLEQFINGTEAETVLTRLSAQYPTLQRALKELFENSGIAGRFKTLADLQVSTLVDGDYALVADDVDDKNGIYIKNGANWVKSKYDTTLQVVSNILPLMNDIYGYTDLSSELNPSREVTPSNFPTGTYGVARYDTNFDTIMYDVDGVSRVAITGADESLGWEWIITDADVSTRVKVTGNFGNGVIDIPPEGKKLIRTYTSRRDSKTESAVLVKGVFKKSIKELNDDILTKADAFTFEEVLPIEPINNALININKDTSALFATGEGPNRQYLAYDVSKIDELTITGAQSTDAGAEWVFSNSLETTADRHSFTGFYGNGVLKIPRDVKYALRSYYFAGNQTYPKFEENASMVIKAKRTGPKREDWRSIVGLLEENSSKQDPHYEYAQKVIKESGLNIYKLSEFEGANSHDKIDNAIEFIKRSGIGGILDLESGVHLRNSAILMPDNFWLYLNDSTLMLADGVHDNLIRNEGIEVNPDPFGFALNLNENRNIRIFGNGKDRSFIKGPSVPKTAPHPIDGGGPVPWVGDWYGWRTLEINLANVKDYAIHGFSLLNTRCWGITQQHGCQNFEIHDIHFNNNVKNGDGIDILMGCKNGKVYNLSGYTHDDMLALSAAHEFVMQLPYLKYIYPMMIGSWVDRGFGIDIEDIKISNIKGGGGHHALRLLPTGGAKIKNISVNRVHDDPEQVGFAEATVVLDTGYGTNAKQGDLFNVTINDVKSYRARYSVKIVVPLSDVIFNNIVQMDSAKAAIAESSRLATYDNVKFVNITGSWVDL